MLMSTPHVESLGKYFDSSIGAAIVLDALNTAAILVAGLPMAFGVCYTYRGAGFAPSSLPRKVIKSFNHREAI